MLKTRKERGEVELFKREIERNFFSDVRLRDSIFQLITVGQFKQEGNRENDRKEKI
jgi:hypothetical protein